MTDKDDEHECTPGTCEVCGGESMRRVATYMLNLPGFKDTADEEPPARVQELPNQWQELIETRATVETDLMNVLDMLRGRFDETAIADQVQALRDSLISHWHRREDAWLDRWAALEQEVRRLGGDPRTIVHRAHTRNTRNAP